MWRRVLAIALWATSCAAPGSKMPWPAESTAEAETDAPPAGVQSSRAAPVSSAKSASRVAKPARRVCAPLTQRITIRVARADLVSVLTFIADEAQLNLVVDSDVRGEVTADLRNVTVGAALDALMKSNGLDAVVDGCILSAQMR